MIIAMAVRPIEKPLFKHRWDRADLSQYQLSCSNMLDQLHIPTDAVLCSKVNCTFVTKLGPFGITLSASLNDFGISVLVSYISSTGYLVL